MLAACLLYPFWAAGAVLYANGYTGYFSAFVAFHRRGGEETCGEEECPWGWEAVVSVGGGQHLVCRSVLTAAQQAQGLNPGIRGGAPGDPSCRQYYGVVLRGVRRNTRCK